MKGIYFIYTDVESEGTLMKEVLYWTFLSVIPIISGLMAKTAYKQKRRFAASLFVTAIFTFVLFVLTSAWWYFSAYDGFSQILGILYFAIAWFVTLIINSILLLVLRNKLSS